MNIRMRTIKYIISFILLLLTISVSQASGLNVKLTLNIDGSAISDTFYVDLVNNHSLSLLFETEQENFDDDKFYVYDAKNDSVDVIERLEKGLFSVFVGAFDDYTETGRLTYEARIYKGLSGTRLAVYFPKTKMIYVSKEFRLHKSKTYNVKVTGDSSEPIVFSGDSWRTVAIVFLSVLTGFIIMMISSSLLNFWGFQPDLRSKITIFAICVIFGCFSNSLMINNAYSIVAMIAFYLLCLLMPLIILLSHLYLRIEGRRRWGRLIFFSLVISIIMDIAVFFIICGGSRL